MASFVATQSTQSSQRELRHNIRSLATSVQREIQQQNGLRRLGLKNPDLNDCLSLAGQGDDLADINNLPQITTVLQRLNTYHDKGTPALREAKLSCWIPPVLYLGT